jgi:hypothetical protein
MFHLTNRVFRHVFLSQLSVFLIKLSDSFGQLRPFLSDFRFALSNRKKLLYTSSTEINLCWKHGAKLPQNDICLTRGVLQESVVPLPPRTELLTLDTSAASEFYTAVLFVGRLADYTPGETLLFFTDDSPSAALSYDVPERGQLPTHPLMVLHKKLQAKQCQCLEVNDLSNCLGLLRNTKLSWAFVHCLGLFLCYNETEHFSSQEYTTVLFPKLHVQHCFIASKNHNFHTESLSLYH